MQHSTPLSSGIHDTTAHRRIGGTTAVLTTVERHVADPSLLTTRRGPAAAGTFLPATA